MIALSAYDVLLRRNYQPDDTAKHKVSFGSFNSAGVGVMTITAYNAVLYTF